MLKKYSSFKSSSEFISKLDFINFYEFIYNPKAHNECVDLFYECLIYTFGCYINKLSMLYHEKILSKEDAQKLVDDMIYNAPETMFLMYRERDIPNIYKIKRHIPSIGNINNQDRARFKILKKI